MFHRIVASLTGRALLQGLSSICVAGVVRRAQWCTMRKTTKNTILRIKQNQDCNHALAGNITFSRFFLRESGMNSQQMCCIMWLNTNQHVSIISFDSKCRRISSVRNQQIANSIWSNKHSDWSHGTLIFLLAFIKRASFIAVECLP